MLMFIYIVQKRFANIRSFIFVDMLLEVTEYFKEQEWDKAPRRSLEVFILKQNGSLNQCNTKIAPHIVCLETVLDNF